MRLVEIAATLYARRFCNAHLAAPCGRHEHQQLLTTVVARDADKAVTLLRTHITRTEQLVAAMLHGASGENFQ